MASGSLLLEPHHHVVNFYDDDEHLIAEVSRFVAVGLRAGEAAVTLATQAHGDAIDAALRADGIDCEGARKTGKYVCLDATEMLTTIMAGTELLPGRFRTVVGGIIRRLGADGRRVRAFGEMVALLWGAGNLSGAIELESRWNELAKEHPFSLYCAYPMPSLAAVGDLTATSRVCERHSSVIAPRSYASASVSPVGLDDAANRSELFVPVTGAVTASRRFVGETLDAWDESDLLDDATLIASELAMNAVVHASSAFRVVVCRDQATIRIAVQDISPTPPVCRSSGTGVPGGRGIAIVDRLSSRWGAETRVDGKTVWAELARSSQP